MFRFLVSLLVGLVIGVGVGLYLGWEQFPARTVNGPATSLDQNYKDDYTVMIAAGYAGDHDLNGALERMRILGLPNIPEYVQQVTERYISNSQDVNDIRLLVGLSEDMGRLTPIMEPYRQVSVPGQGTGS
jgi:hypothetical protein